MTGVVLGVGGAAVGLVLSAAAWMSERKRRRRGEADEGFGFRNAKRSDGIERFIILRAAAWSFPAVLLALSVYGPLQDAFHWSHPGSAVVGVAWGIGGAAFGLSCALVARRAA